jgi:hypothetical protein
VRKNTAVYDEWENHVKNSTASHEIDYQGWLSTRSEFRENIDFVLAAVEQNGRLLEYACDELKNNPNVVLTAMKQNPQALVFASSNLKGNKDFIFYLLYSSYPSLPHSYRFKYSDIIDVTLNYASQKLINDREFMLKLLLKLLSVFRINHAIKCMNENLRNDKEFILDIIKHDTKGRLLASEFLQQDTQVFFTIVKRKGLLLREACDEIKKDKEIVLAAVKSAGCALKSASSDLKDDEDVVFAAMNQRSGYALRFASERIQNNKEFIIKLIKILEPNCLNSMILFFRNADKHDINDLFCAIRHRLKDCVYRKIFKKTYRKKLPNEIKDKLSFDILSTPKEMSDYMQVLFDTKRYKKLEPIGEGRYETSIFNKIMFFLPRQDRAAVKTSFTRNKQGDYSQQNI